MLAKSERLRSLAQYLAPIIVLVGGAVLGLPGLIGIWLPDVATGNIVTVATAANARGDAFVITQQWSSDFYKTWLTHSEPSGRVTKIMLDPDGPRIWRCSMHCDEDASTLNIPLFGSEIKYHWDFHTRYSLAGDSK
jgi:hypothetical protein